MVSVNFKINATVVALNGEMFQSFTTNCSLFNFKDLFAVGMLLPLFNRRGRALGASPSTLGVIG